jgi:hypothetical protein
VTAVAPASAARLAIATVLAGAFGIGFAWLDSRPGFDDTGVTAAGLLLAAAISTLLAGSRPPWVAIVLAVLVGVWIPLVEVPGTGSMAPLVALPISLAGAAVGAVVMAIAARPASSAER